MKAILIITTTTIIITINNNSNNYNNLIKEKVVGRAELVEAGQSRHGRVGSLFAIVLLAKLGRC